MLLGGLLVIGLLGVFGCTSDNPTVPSIRLDAETGFWNLTLNHEAVTLSLAAPQDTIQLVPTPRNSKGESLMMEGLSADSIVTTYTTLDPGDTSITVTADGLVRGRYAHDGSGVIVRTRVRNVTRADTIPVNVTAEAPVMVAGFTLQVAPDSLFLTSLSGAPGTSAVTGIAVDGQGQVIQHVAVKFASSDLALQIVPDFVGSSMAMLEQPNSLAGSGSFRGPGRIVVSAEATVYGVTVRDSTPVTLLPPSRTNLSAVFGTPHSTGTPVGYFEPVVDTMKLENGSAFVVFGSVPDNPPIDVIFDAPPGVVHAAPIVALVCREPPSTAVITSFTLDARNTAEQCQFRRSSQWLLLNGSGTYRYHSALYGTRGSIVVLP
jgi:hypothetical protein